MRARTHHVLALLLPAALSLAACGEDTAPAATASPTPSVAAAGPFVLPPAGTPAPADTSPAGLALAAAARKTSDAGAFRINLSATFKGATAAASGTMTGIGETESHTRFHLTLSFNLGTQQLTTETTTFDGVTWGRSSTQPWHVVSGSTPTDPRSYLRYLAGASAVHDAGPGTHDGQPAERYEAAVDLSRATATPAAAAPGPAGALGTLVAWVDPVSGRLTGEELNSAPTSGQPTHLAISYLDFGGAIRVVPPLPSP